MDSSVPLECLERTVGAAALSPTPSDWSPLTAFQMMESISWPFRTGKSLRNRKGGHARHPAARACDPRWPHRHALPI